MKTCLICDTKIPSTIIIDGKRRNTKNRKYCFSCSPFGKHNTKSLHVNETDRICIKCNKNKPITEFYTRRNTNLSAYCKQCVNNTTLTKQQYRKKLAVEYKGGKCQICGYNKYNGALDFHHIDKDKKDYAISDIQTASFETIKPELDKCILLCKNCHSEVHGNIIVLSDYMK